MQGLGECLCAVETCRHLRQMESWFLGSTYVVVSTNFGPPMSIYNIDIHIYICIPSVLLWGPKKGSPSLRNPQV